MYIYVIGQKGGPYKVGITNNLTRRLSNLQIGSSDKLEIWHSVEVLDKQSAQSIEASTHIKLKDFYIRGEWFSASLDQIIDCIPTHKQSEGRIDIIEIDRAYIENVNKCAIDMAELRVPISSIIKTKHQYDIFITAISILMARNVGYDSPEGRVLEMLLILTQKFEQELLPAMDIDPVQMLEFAISSMGRSQSQLAELLGSRSRASEILNRKRLLDLKQVWLISEAWKLPVEVLAKPYRLEKKAA